MRWRHVGRPPARRPRRIGPTRWRPRRVKPAITTACNPRAKAPARQAEKSARRRKGFFDLETSDSQDSDRTSPQIAPPLSRRGDSLQRRPQPERNRSSFVMSLERNRSSFLMSRDQTRSSFVRRNGDEQVGGQNEDRRLGRPSVGHGADPAWRADPGSAVMPSFVGRGLPTTRPGHTCLYILPVDRVAANP